MDDVGRLDLEDLTAGERLLLSSLRLQALGAACTGWKGQLEQACGFAGGEAGRALAAFVEQLRLKARRRIGLRLPGAPVSDDEARLLCAFASAQADDYRTLDVELEGLVAGRPPACLGAAACLIAQAFAMGGLLLRRIEPRGRSVWPPEAAVGSALWM